MKNPERILPFLHFSLPFDTHFLEKIQNMRNHLKKINIDGNVYQEIVKGILELEKCKVNEDILSIPGEIFYKTTKYKISEIGDKFFFGCKQLKFIKIPSSVESIGKHCFSESNVETVEIENNSKLQTIGRYAFSDCKQLKFVKIP